MDVTERAVGDSELSFCRAVPGGTGITVAALLLTTKPDMNLLQISLRTLQIRYPILRSKLHYSRSTHSFSFLTPPSPSIILKSSSTLSTFHDLIEQELNINPWKNITEEEDRDVMESTLYHFEGCGKWAVIIKAHTAVCDRSSGEILLREVVRLLGIGGGEGEKDGEMKLGIEEYLGSDFGKRSVWARGVNMLAHSLNSLRLSNINFVDTHAPRSSRLILLRLHPPITAQLLQGCRRREMKLCGALAAAALIAARRSKVRVSEGQREKYGVATIVDCRSLLHPPLNTNQVGFYHAVIINTQEINGKESLWDLAEKMYKSFKEAKKKKKHLSEMSDLNFLMRRALENPGLTPSAASRTSFVSVFEDEILHKPDAAYKAMGVEDHIGTSSAHGLGPSLTFFPTIRADGGLECGCIYPGPLHSPVQMHALVDSIKSILVEAVTTN